MTKYSLNRINHYIPPRDFEKIEVEWIEPNPEDYFIWWLFRYRCASCFHEGQEINEIIPRSRDKNAVMEWRNRILLCRDCHEKYHHDGVTDEKIEDMKTIRRRYLLSVNRGEYA